MASSAEQATSMEDRINLHQLMELKAAFDRADTDGGGSLDIDEFLVAFGEVLGKNLTHEQLTHLFMKIDANSDGSVDWDEFTNFMLLENQAASDMSDRSYSERLQETDPKIDHTAKHHYHRDMMDGILQPQGGNLFTHSRDGTVRVWNAGTLSHMKTLRVSDSWVTNTCHFEQSNRIGVASIDRTISYYDANSCELVGQLTGLDTAPLCLGCWNDQSQERMIVGDDCGHIAIFDTQRQGSSGSSEATMSAASYRIFHDKNRHADWVTKVHYYPDLNFMISSSLDGTLKIDGELGRKNATTRTLGEAQTPHSTVKRGVYSFAWSGTSKLLASCGLERTISLWNPYTRNPKPLAVLQGHTASVLHVAINDEGFQLYSCSTDKCIKVWDLRSHKCLQTIHDKTHYRPEDRITAMAFDPIHSRLITGTTKLRPWPLIKAATRSIKPKHEHALCAALYNKNFHQIVSGDESAQVCVWDVEKGEMVFHFTDLHETKMTAMAFDEAGRRLITGANDGTVRVWNFSNGQRLQNLKNDGALEVSSITFIVEGQNKFIVAGGWNRKVLVWRDENSGSSAPVEPDRNMSGHEEDILSIAYSPPNLLATSGYDGRLLIWNMDSEHLKFTLTTPHVENLDVDQRAMWKLVFLQRRSQALVSGSADGKLRFWNVKEGCLVWEQHSHHKNSDGVVALATELTNSFLFSGDGAGYMKLWDICQFLNVAGLDQRGKVLELAHWKAHDDCIASVDFVEKHRLILTSSTDTHIKLWSFDGTGVFLAGILGETAALWSLSDKLSFEPVELEPPRGAKAAPPPAPAPIDGEGAPAPTSTDANGDEAGSVPKLNIRGGKSSPELEEAQEGPMYDTPAMIQQILQGRGTRRQAAPGTFRSLRTHDLKDVSQSPRGTGDSPRHERLQR